MTAIFALCFFALLCIILQATAGELAPKFKLFLGVAAGIVFLFTFAKWIEPLYSYIKALTSQEESASYFLLLFKGLGISFLISVSAEICRDM